MEETLTYTRFIAFHRNQINPEPHPRSTLTFAYGDEKYRKFLRYKWVRREDAAGDEQDR